jgi:ubiquitin-conjugating enzyme E2 Z
MKEISNVRKSSDIFIDVDEKDMTTFKILFFGPSDSVYHHGIFVFEMKLSDNYPFDVPKVKFLTGGMINARIHPNLYQDGKVCLSILNTWGGKEWSPLLTIEKVFITIRALLDKNPIAHEPAYNSYKENNPLSIAYSLNAEYYSIKSIIDVMNFYNNISPLSPFREIIKKYIQDNKKDILEKIEKFEDKIKEKSIKSLTTLHHKGIFYKDTLQKVKEVL